MIGFAYSLRPVGFRAIWMSFLGFMSQNTYPEEFLRPEVILSQTYLRKCSIWRPPPPHSHIINFSFFKNVIKSESLGVRGYYFQDFHISMTPITGKNFKKIHEVRVTCPGLFNMELPIDAFFPLSNRCCDHCKNVFYSFS